MNLELLKARDIEGIKEWLREPKVIFCPMPWHERPLLHGLEYCEFCKNLFPKLQEKMCPCYQYSFKYVVKKARDIVKQWEEVYG